METNTINPDQTAPEGAVRSGSIVFAIKATKEHQQIKKQVTIVMNCRRMVYKFSET